MTNFKKYRTLTEEEIKNLDFLTQLRLEKMLQPGDVVLQDSEGNMSVRRVRMLPGSAKFLPSKVSKQLPKMGVLFPAEPTTNNN